MAVSAARAAPVPAAPAPASARGVLSHDDALALLRLAVDAAEMVRASMSAPALLVHLALRVQALGMRLLPPEHCAVGYPTWGEPIDRALRLHLMDGRDDEVLATWECRLDGHPTNGEWSEVEKLIARDVARLMVELRDADRLAGDEPC